MHKKEKLHIEDICFNAEYIEDGGHIWFLESSVASYMINYVGLSNNSHYLHEHMFHVYSNGEIKEEYFIESRDLILLFFEYLSSEEVCLCLAKIANIAMKDKRNYSLFLYGIADAVRNSKSLTYDNEKMNEIRDFVIHYLCEIYREENIFAREALIEEFQRSIATEFDIQEMFKFVANKCHGLEILDKGNNGRDIPDVWVKQDYEPIPVEVKLKDFNKKALRQLQRYMDRYMCERGIAVAEKLTTQLPENIEFVSRNSLIRIYNKFMAT